MELKEKLQKTMNNKKISIENLVEKTGIGETTIRDYLKGNQPKSLYFVNKLAEALDVSTMYLADDRITNDNYTKADIGEELNISDEAIKKIQEVKKIIHFDNDLYYKQKLIGNEINSSTNDILNKNKKVELTYDNKTFSYFIEHFYNLPSYINVFREFIKLKETLLNVDYLKTICNIKDILKKHIKNKNKVKLDKIINIYDLIFDALQFTSNGTLLNYNINYDIKKLYFKVKDIIKTFNVKNLDESMEDLQSSLYETITYINKELKRCEYEMNLKLSEYYKQLLEEEENNYLKNNNSPINAFLNNLIKENEKIEKGVNNNGSKRTNKE